MNLITEDKSKRNLPSNWREREKEPTFKLKRKEKRTYLLTAEKRELNLPYNWREKRKENTF